MLNTLPNGGDDSLVIYVNRIGADSYVGMTNDGIERAAKTYANNVRRMLEGRLYHQKGRTTVRCTTGCAKRSSQASASRSN